MFEMRRKEGEIVLLVSTVYMVPVVVHLVLLATPAVLKVEPLADKKVFE